MKRKNSRGNSGGVGLVVLCVLALTIGRNLYDGLSSVAFAEPASSGYGVGSSRVASSPYGAPRVLGTLEDPLLTETSGMVASRANDDVYWVHNDSGTYAPYLFCIYSDGSACGRWTIPGAEDLDWEGISWGPSLDGEGGYLYVGDIGDNFRARDSVTIYAFPEPVVPGDADAETLRTTDAPVEIELTYPGRAHDAETLMVHPISGDLYIVTKDGNSHSVVYKRSSPLSSGVMVKVARFRIFDNFSERTGGDISPDGTRVIFSTSLGGYEKRGTGGDFDRIWSASAVKVDLGSIRQREAIAFSADGKRILTTSEGASAELIEVGPLGR